MLVQSLLHSAVKYLFIYFVGQKVLQVVRSEYKIPSRYIFLIIEFKLPPKLLNPPNFSETGQQTETKLHINIKVTC